MSDDDDPVRTARLRARPADAPLDPTGDAMRARMRAAMFGVASEPTRIGRFTILETIGAGGMGAVYAAHDPVLDRRVAVKLVRSPDPAAHARLLDEARALARLAHPNIVAIHDAGTVDDRVYLAMELVDGESLRAWAIGRGWREVVAAHVAVARGLAAAHAAGVVHGDVKPDNAVVGRDGRVRVIDFGLARSGTIDGASLAGTPAFMAPELFDGHARSERADQYAFAIGLRGVALPARVAKVVARGCAADPLARFPSMAALADALERAARPRWTTARVAIAGTAVVAIVAIVALVARGDAAQPAPEIPPAQLAQINDQLARAMDDPAAKAWLAQPPLPGNSPLAKQMAAVRASYVAAQARAKVALARSLWQGGDHARAHAVAVEARAALADAGGAAAELDDLDRWIAEH